MYIFIYFFANQSSSLLFWSRFQTTFLLSSSSSFTDFAFCSPFLIFEFQIRLDIYINFFLVDVYSVITHIRLKGNHLPIKRIVNNAAQQTPIDALYVYKCTTSSFTVLTRTSVNANSFFFSSDTSHLHFYYRGRMNRLQNETKLQDIIKTMESC